jgi:uncharacterized 2Fe-2S/4Fe-4S cluster protein (DUF4445 family)
MSEWIHIVLLPAGARLKAARGAALEDVLFERGVEFPCGGRGRCRACRVRVINGCPPPTPEDLLKFSPKELSDGWRLSCQIRCDRDMTIELAQWEAAILSDESAFAFTPRAGFGIAIDLGTTTLAAQLVNLENGQVRATRTTLNPQARHGADVMSRIEFALSGGSRTLTELIRDALVRLAEGLMDEAGLPATSVKRVVVAGNTVMHHLFCGLSVEPLAVAPFETAEGGLQCHKAESLGWNAFGRTEVCVLPCLGGFVGGDILAGILATGMDQRNELAVLADLGTNGEIVIGNATRMLCASTAAGPAFEGARISMGMRAVTGAISHVRLKDKQMECRVLGGGNPAGLCGSGLVDVAACALDLGLITPSGRVSGGKPFHVAGPVFVTPKDIRELQFAKGAIAAGIRMLLDQAGARREDVARVFLAGAFGNYINRASAQRIGMLGFPAEVIQPVGNTALLGAKIALFAPSAPALQYVDLRARVTHWSLGDDPLFQDVFAEEMAFPQGNEHAAPNRV